MIKTILTACGCALLAGVLISCQKETPEAVQAVATPEQQSLAADPVVADTLKNLTELDNKVRTMHPGASIKEYKDITDSLVQANAIPAGFIKNGKAENAWTGKIIVQIFPQNAWKSGVRPTINYVLESIPRVECTQIVQALGNSLGKSAFKLNVEPSGKVLYTMPVGNEQGCSDGVNNIGYTVLAN